MLSAKYYLLKSLALSMISNLLCNVYIHAGISLIECEINFTEIKALVTR